LNFWDILGLLYLLVGVLLWVYIIAKLGIPRDITSFCLSIISLIFITLFWALSIESILNKVKETEDA
jgi:hypothetical protein